MVNAYIKSRHMQIAVALLTILIVVLRYMSSRAESPMIRREIGCARSAAYLVLYTGWVISVNGRIIQKQTRKLLMAIGCLAIFWIILRTVKYYFTYDNNVKRYIWYMYYIPIIMMPTLCALVALAVGKPDEWRLPGRSKLLIAAAAGLAALVILNDFHQLAFRFLTPEWDEGNIEYGSLYIAVAVWGVFCGFSGLCILLKKSRIPYSRRFMVLPFVPAAVSVIYCIAYYMRAPFIFKYIGDISAVMCLCFILTMECCIQCGLIRSNSNYDGLFSVSSIHAMITDRNYNIILASEDAVMPTVQQMLNAQKEPVLLDGGIRLLGKSIREGYVFWTEDVSELSQVLAELEEAGDYLEGERKVMAREYETEREQRRALEKNRLYNKILTKTNAQIRLYEKLAKQLESTEDPKEIQYLVSRIAVVSTYIKRRDNMLFLDEYSEQDAGQEMKFCMEETAGAIRLCGVQCEYTVNTYSRVSVESIAWLYEIFYEVMVYALDGMSHLYIYVNEEEKDLVLTMYMICSCDLSKIMVENTVIQKDGSGWIVTVKTLRGGAEQ